MNSEEHVRNMVYSALRDLGAELNNTELANPTGELRLIGSSSPLDSMGLVSLIADLEGRIAAEFGKELVLADESAMSAYRSPFRSVDALVQYINKRVSAESL